MNVTGGTLRFNLGAGPATVGVGVTATVAAGATLELAGSFSALASTANQVNIKNDSQAIAGGILVSGIHQQVGSIDGTGNVVIAAGRDLTASAIRQNALIIGGTAGSPATGHHRRFEWEQRDGRRQTTDRRTRLADCSMNALLLWSGTRIDPFGLNSHRSELIHRSRDMATRPLAPSETAVPEPSTIVLALLAVLIAARHLRRQ